jgi:hypothetical protein
MCGSLKRENMDKRIGHPVPNYFPGNSVPILDNEGKASEAFWNGHAREESLQEKFLSRGWKEGRLDVTHYSEGYQEKRKVYQVPTNEKIKIVYRQSETGKTIFNIVTRDARGEELNVHPRFPKCIKE